ncbi:MAG TPA: hypothetical protein VI895_15090 [Bdellovibrionota bacterium]|nr:hypothetical protein [Bdellovibrionota bacterium]
MSIKRNKDNRGQGMTEYLIIVALMAISAIAVMSKTSKIMKTGFGGVAKALQGEEQQHETTDIGTTETQASDMGDFTQGVNND